MDLKQVGDKVTISSWGFTKYPATVVGVTKSGKTITIKKNKFETENRNHGPMVLKIEKVHDELDSEEMKFRWKPYNDGTDGGYWLRMNHGYDTLMNKPGWDDLQLDIGL